MPTLTAAEMRRRVARARVGRLATVDERGRPHLVPLCFALDGDVLYSAVDEKPKGSRRLKRLANVRARPHVTVLVDHYEQDWSRLWWVRLDGVAQVLDEGAAAERAIELLVAKYPQYRRGPPTPPVLTVRIEGWRGWSAG